MPYRDMPHGTQHTTMAAEKKVVFALFFKQGTEEIFVNYAGTRAE